MAGDPEVIARVQKLCGEFFETCKIEYASNQRMRAEDAIRTWIEQGRIAILPKPEEWPERGTHILVAVVNEHPATPDWIVERLHLITRPAPAWRPNEGQDVWIGWSNGDVIHHVWRASSSPALYTVFVAAAHAIEERQWTVAQFEARGEFWRVNQ